MSKSEDQVVAAVLQIVQGGIEMSVTLARKVSSKEILDLDSLEYLAGYAFSYTDVFVQAFLGKDSSSAESLALTQIVFNNLFGHKVANQLFEDVNIYVDSGSCSPVFEMGVYGGNGDVNRYLDFVGKEDKDKPVGLGMRELLKFFMARAQRE